MQRGNCTHLSSMRENCDSISHFKTATFFKATRASVHIYIQVQVSISDRSQSLPFQCAQRCAIIMCFLLSTQQLEMLNMRARDHFQLATFQVLHSVAGEILHCTCVSAQSTLGLESYDRTIGSRDHANVGTSRRSALVHLLRTEVEVE